MNSSMAFSIVFAISGSVSGSAGSGSGLHIVIGGSGAAKTRGYVKPNI